MADAVSQDAFEEARPGLLRLAHRMLGSHADADDILQEASIRWLHVNHQTVVSPAAFLRRTVMRLCLDRLKADRRRREAYVGSWLPEPVLTTEEEDPDVTLPLLLALERLSPLERASFLLHDIFGLPFDEVASAIDREPATCRQLARRARQHVRAARPRYPIPKERGLQIAQAFFVASREGNMDQLRALLRTDVTLYADGGGKVPARKAPASGLSDVLQVFDAFAAIYAASPSRLVQFGFINGLPGFVTIEQHDVLQTTGLEMNDEGIVAIYIVRNPDKLRRLQQECGY
jgi:RNA polymerase sigma-70 factor, ECF subfamily